MIFIMKSLFYPIDKEGEQQSSSASVGRIGGRFSGHNCGVEPGRELLFPDYCREFFSGIPYCRWFIGRVMRIVAAPGIKIHDAFCEVLDDPCTAALPRFCSTYLSGWAIECIRVTVIQPWAEVQSTQIHHFLSKQGIRCLLAEVLDVFVCSKAFGDHRLQTNAPKVMSNVSIFTCHVYIRINW